MIADWKPTTTASTARRQRRGRGTRWWIRVASALTLAVVASACGGDESDSAASAFADQGAAVLVANAPGTVTVNGPQRVLVALLGDGPNDFLGDASEPVTIEFLAPESGEPSSSLGTFVSTDGVALGLYVTRFEFDRTGQWGVRLAGGTGEGTAGFVQVVDESVVPAPGEPAPPSVTPTGSSPDELAAITTDPDPNPDFYDLSIEAAVTNGRPTAIIFSTPAFCQTALCGPTVELVKEVAADHPDIDFVHVEPFDLDEARAGSLVPNEVMLEWRLPTEPWIFMVDSNGLVAAAFEGLVGHEELDEALSTL